MTGHFPRWATYFGHSLKPVYAVGDRIPQLLDFWAKHRDCHNRYHDKHSDQNRIFRGALPFFVHEAHMRPCHATTHTTAQALPYLLHTSQRSTTTHVCILRNSRFHNSPFSLHKPQKHRGHYDDQHGWQYEHRGWHKHLYGSFGHFLFHLRSVTPARFTRQRLEHAIHRTSEAQATNHVARESLERRHTAAHPKLEQRIVTRNQAAFPLQARLSTQKSQFIIKSKAIRSKSPLERHSSAHAKRERIDHLWDVALKRQLVCLLLAMRQHTSPLAFPRQNARSASCTLPAANLTSTIDSPGKQIRECNHGEQTNRDD
nr:hypothetical protein [uncultured Slackia sp.]